MAIDNGDTHDFEDGEIAGEDAPPHSHDPQSLADAEDDDADGLAVDSGNGDGPRRNLPLSHPLEHSWTFWFDNPSGKTKQQAWGSSIRPIYTFSTVEDFWGLYNNINKPSKLGLKSDFHCFKHGIEPKWEDPVCANGGKWTISCSRGKSDDVWLYTLLAMIGEQFDYGDEICGAVVNIRNREEKVSIWTKNGQNKDAQVSIGNQWKAFVDCNDSIGFILHEDAIRLDRNAKSIYQV